MYYIYFIFFDAAFPIIIIFYKSIFLNIFLLSINYYRLFIYLSYSNILKLRTIRYLIG